MISDTGLIVVSIISLAGMVLLFTLNNSTWFKKENFKIQKSNVMAQNKLTLRQMERDMGLKPTKKIVSEEPKSTVDLAKDFIPILKNLSGEQIQALADKFLSPEDQAYEEPGGDLTGMLIKYATENPELVEGLLKGLSEGKNAGGQSQV